MRHVRIVLRCFGAVGLLVCCTFACGNDTAPDPEPEGDGGSAGDGAGGNTSTSTSTSAGGAGGGTQTTTVTTTTGGFSNTGLVEPCTSDDDCDGDLICVTADSNSLIAGGPANGMCTLPCETTCEADFGDTAICLSFGDGGKYCMPFCAPGDGVHDCAARVDVACDAVVGSTGACTTTADCDGGAQCVDNQCLVAIPVCLPKCRADSDCPADRFCDPSLGECVDAAPTGLGLGEACDPAAATDECQGYCDGTVEPARCAETCVFGVYPACGSDNPDQGSAECLSPFFSGANDRGDLGYCFGLCDCNSDCPEGLSCIAFASPDIGLDPVRGREGFCDTEQTNDTILTCE